MTRWLKLAILTSVINLPLLPAWAQDQTCPVNINFSSGDISSWSAKTGLVNGPSRPYPAPNTGVSSISEYSIATTGVIVIKASFSDPFGGFPTVPVINGYAYGYSIQIGSTATSCNATHHLYGWQPRTTMLPSECPFVSPTN